MRLFSKPTPPPDLGAILDARLADVDTHTRMVYGHVEDLLGELDLSTAAAQDVKEAALAQADRFARIARAADVHALAAQELASQLHRALNSER